MDAILFLKEYNRMCDSVRDCAACEFNKHMDVGISNCRRTILENNELVVKIVEKWSRENPIKTLMDDFFEKFPNAPKDERGFPSEACPFMLGYDKGCQSPTPFADEYCVKCWSRPLEVTK